MHCHACAREIEDDPLVIGPLVLCPTLCVPEPEPDYSAQAERMAVSRAREKS
jgi:hypothetical protein